MNSNKMSLQELKDLFPDPKFHYYYKSPDGLYVRSGKHAASKKLHRHVHGTSLGEKNHEKFVNKK